MFTQWWGALGLASQIFYLIAIPASLVLVVQTVLMFLGLDNDADGDIDFDLDGDADFDAPDAEPHDGIFGEHGAEDLADSAGLESLHIFTVRGIVAFFVVFGWVGVAMLGAGASLAVTLPIAFVCGVAMMFGIAYLFKASMKLRSDGNTDNRNAIGNAGRVQLTVPPARSGEGKVHIMLQGAYVERSAVTDEEESIPTGSEIVVVGISGQTDLVVKRK